MIYLSYQSKYSGSEIDSKLDLVDNKSDLSYVNEQLNNKANINDITDLQGQIDSKANQSDLLNKIYPIGSIYQSVASTSPASFLGGTWEVLSGQFLIGANSTYSAGTTGGATTHTHTSAAHTHAVAGHTHSTSGHTLTISEMPSHAHKVAIGTSDNNNLTYWGECRAYGSGSNWGYGYSNTPPGNQVYAIYAGGGSSHSHGNTGSTSLTTNSTTPDNTGSSSNLPPYLSVYMWKRIS